MMLSWVKATLLVIEGNACYTNGSHKVIQNLIATRRIKTKFRSNVQDEAPK